MNVDRCRDLAKNAKSCEQSSAIPVTGNKLGWLPHRVLSRSLVGLCAFSSACSNYAVAAAQVETTSQASTIADLQRQIDDLRAIVEQLKAAEEIVAASSSTPAPPSIVLEEPVAVTTPIKEISQSAAWYEKFQLRGYTQLRMSDIVSGGSVASAGMSRLRSMHDGDIRDGSNFSFRRLRIVLQGDINEHLALYFQSDFAASVSNQSVGERREGAVSLRDMYVDVFPTGDKEFRIRLGQSKVPYGWENMQSSGSRVPLDRSDAINTAAPGERDIGIIGYYTPPRAQAIWDRLDRDGHKLFGNYGAFGFGVFNGQGTNRTEVDDEVMMVGLATWPFKLDGLGFDGQVLELGAQVMQNRFRPELRTGGLSPVGFKDNRVGLHAVLYPQPIGLQVEWNWGKGPEFDPVSGGIEERPLTGGYVQLLGKVDNMPIGPFFPYARWQYYRGGLKSAINAPRLETEELDLGFELQVDKALELTASYGWASRREPDERRLGRAEGEFIRLQAQWNY